MGLEKGNVLMEVLLMIGLFLLFILMINRSLMEFSIAIQKIDGANDQRMEAVNRNEACRSRKP